MNHKEDHIDFYLKKYPQLRKWINKCPVCHSKGYKPEMPARLAPEGSVAAQNLRRYLHPMAVNELGLCTQCAKYFPGTLKCVKSNASKAGEPMPQNTPEYEIKYIELKSGHHDDGPAWIGRVKKSKSGRTFFFNIKAFQKHTGNYANHFDVESGERYWISGIKKDGHDRHWAGKGKITIDRKVIPEYLSITGEKELDPSRFIIADIEDRFLEERIHKFVNAKRTARYGNDEG